LRQRFLNYIPAVNAVLENPDKVWTYENYLALDDEVWFEIINGKAFMSPAPELFYQRWVGRLFIIVERYVQSQKLGEVFVAPVDVVLDRENVVQPDLVFVSASNAGLLERRGVMGVPDLVVEVISPQSLRRDRYDKRELYARFGVKEFWLADVANRTIEVLTFQKGDYQLFSSATNERKIHSVALPEFELDLAQLD
jgi:Uma2 family endonuclease